MTKDYYKILGVSRNASQEEIKRAYRKLAHECHPDKNDSHADGERFKEVNEAYQILKDPNKRARYDQFGTADANDFSGFGGQGGQNVNWGDFSTGFSGFGNLGDIFEDFFSGAFSQVQSEIEIKLTSAILGETLNLKTSQGEEITLRIPPGTQDGQSFRFKGKGAPTRRGRGDLIITVRVHQPRNISREQREILEDLRNSGL